jgi:alpha-glucosidase
MLGIRPALFPAAHRVTRAAVAGTGDGPSVPWWQSGVLYQVYLRSFADSDGDGTGDLPGVIERLDYLRWLGVDGIWLSPLTRSPNADWGYDVSDYLEVDPELGTLDDVDRLIAEAGDRHIRVVMDLIPNHTSDRHPWFLDARSSPEAAHRQWYVWADPRPDGGRPNNWVSSFGGPAWTLDDASGQYYLHNHLVEQPDLNWWNDEVRDEFDRIMDHWLGRGIAGFRIDVCNVIIKDALLRDNPPATESDPLDVQLFGQRPVYSANRPEVHDVIRRWRELADRRPGTVLLGETPVEPVSSLAAYYGTGRDELHLAFNFPFITSPLEAPSLRGIVEDVEQDLPPVAWPVWTGSNHDMSRFATRWADGDDDKIKVALVMLLSLRGTPVLYQGDEIGLGDTEVPRERLRDPLGVLYWPAYAGRDAMRTPMPWRNAPGGGFTGPAVEPWLPFGDLAACNVEDQRDEPGSALRLVRDLIALRRETPALQSGPYRTLELEGAGGAHAWAWSRGDRIVVMAAMGADVAALEGCHGRVLIGTDRQRDGEAVEGELRVAGWEAVVVEREGSTATGQAPTGRGVSPD